MTTLATGIFMWSSPERRSQRYGFIYMDSSNFDQTITVAPTLDMELLRALTGKRVRLSVKVVESRKSGHLGDAALNIKPRRPKDGRVFELGIGTLAIKDDPVSASDMMSFGLMPGDGRAVL